jgi:hypothetical protein
MVAAATAGAADRDLARYVDPFIGTGGHGHTFPGATLPFAMVQLSPDTRLHGWDGCSGYHFSDTGGGSDVLIDGRRGPDDWRLGAWQGFQHTDLEAVVDLKEVRAVRRAGASFIQDARSWIWMPTEVEVWVSEDGVVFHQVARVENDLADDTEEVVRRDLVADLGGVETRFIRVVARNYGTIPDWHPGRGGGAFIFVDEILVE